MKKLLLGLGTIAAVTAPVAAVVACAASKGEDPRNHQSGSATIGISYSHFIRTAMRSVHIRLDKPYDFDVNVLKIRNMISVSDKPSSYIFATNRVNPDGIVWSTTVSNDYEDWMYGLKASFDYDLNFNDERRDKVFYDLTIKNVHLLNKENILNKLKTKSLTMDEVWLPLASPEDEAKAYPEIYKAELDLRKDVWEKNKDKIEEAVYEDKLEFIDFFNNWSIGSAADKYIESNITNETPVKVKGGNSIIDLNFYGQEKRRHG